LSENSLFGETKRLEIKREGDASSLFSDDDDIFKKISLKEKLNVRPIAQKIEEEDLLFSSKSTTKKSTTTTNDVDGDLFSLVDKKTSVQDTKSTNDFDVDDFVAKLKNQTQRALFED